ncbi:hypothetical protein Bb109J_c0325 [Bdellovibrio bacteriovorus]|nr:hypothetical protein Bb109J_c0325 [Bdellovibrio bacteriovorus]
MSRPENTIFLIVVSFLKTNEAVVAPLVGKGLLKQQ